MPRDIMEIIQIRYSRDEEYSVDKNYTNDTANIESQSPNISSGVTSAENDDFFSKVPERAKKNETTRKTWRQRLNILRGTHVGDIETTLSADVYLVAYGLGKGTTNVQLSEWLKAKGVNIKSCDLLTKHEAAQSLPYKLLSKLVSMIKLPIQKYGLRELVLEDLNSLAYKELRRMKRINQRKTCQHFVANLKGLRILLMPVITSPD